MTPKEELRGLLDNAISSKESNTNNGWGFGGVYSIVYQLNNGVTVSYIETCHSPMTSNIHIRAKDKDGKDIFYSKRPTVNQLNKLKNKLL